MMAEINRDVLRSIILDVLQEMGGVHEAPQFKASAGKSTTPSAAPRHEDPTGDDSWLQTAGAFVGATIAAVFYYPHFKETGPDEGNCVGIFATGPAIDYKPCNLMSEIIATFMLILATLCLGKMVDGLAPVVSGILIASIGMSFGATTGYALNPARDFGARLAYTILPIPNKGTANWQYAWVPFIGPLIGAGLAVVFFKLVAP